MTRAQRAKRLRLSVPGAERLSQVKTGSENWGDRQLQQTMLDNIHTCLFIRKHGGEIRETQSSDHKFDHAAWTAGYFILFGIEERSPPRPLKNEVALMIPFSVIC